MIAPWSRAHCSQRFGLVDWLIVVGVEDADLERVAVLLQALDLPPAADLLCQLADQAIVGG
jgi:hypothetical protein